MQKLKIASGIAKKKNDLLCKRNTFETLIMRAQETIKLVTIESQTIKDYKLLTQRRTLLAWRKQTLLSHKGKLAGERHRISVVNVFFERLQDAYFCSSKLSQMCRILQVQNQQAKIRQFMPRLLEYGHFREVTKDIQVIRLRKFFMELKRNSCLKKIEQF